jgi:asparagine synthase (glutamine-hydrolysing)
MVDIQRHRGPDADGMMASGPVAMGMRRLSIIDLAGGDQPISNEDDSLTVVFNGEIFNYIELRDYLLPRGHRFKTKSDTEVLLHLYEELGTGMLERLNGMFAFALWDGARRTLLLARDRMGVKPLYVAQTGARWLFASELKSLITQPGLDTAFDANALADYLRLGYIPLDATPYRGVRKLLPGHALLVREGGRQLIRWWDLASAPAAHAGVNGNGKGTTEEHLRDTFFDAVRLRMRSDVPVASFLSGGLDSSLVTIVAQQYSPQPINTFSMGFTHSEFDELPYARLVADRAHTAHRELTATTDDAIAHLPALLWHMDEPMGDSSIIPNYLISRMAARHVKVCLSGLGGDELFGGYARYASAGIGRIRRLMAPVPAMAGALAPVVDRWNFSWGEELRLASSPAQEYRSYLHRLQIFDSAALERIGFPAAGRTEEIVETLWNRFPGDDPVGRRQFIDQHTYLPDQILALTDRMSMANSLEVRVPFMDYRLLRFSQKLTSAQKQAGGEFKIFLKRALGSLCPPELLTRPKWGFDTPLGRWVSQPGVFALTQKLRSGLAVREGLIAPRRLEQYNGDPQRARRFARRLWSLLALEVWLRVRMRRTAPEESLAELLGDAA